MTNILQLFIEKAHSWYSKIMTVHNCFHLVSNKRDNKKVSFELTIFTWRVLNSRSCENSPINKVLRELMSIGDSFDTMLFPELLSAKMLIFLYA